VHTSTLRWHGTQEIRVLLQTCAAPRTFQLAHRSLATTPGAAAAKERRQTTLHRQRNTNRWTDDRKLEIRGDGQQTHGERFLAPIQGASQALHLNLTGHLVPRQKPLLHVDGEQSLLAAADMTQESHSEERNEDNDRDKTK